MAKDIFDNPPLGYVRKDSKRGWLGPAQTPQSGKISKLQQDNDDLKARLATLEDAINSLTPTKKSKK